MRYGIAVVCVVVAAVLWSGMGLALRQIESAGTWTVLFWRSVGMVPVLLGYIAIASGGRLWQRLCRIGWPGVVGAAGLVLAFAGAIFAIQSTTVANAVFLFSAAPFMAAILGRLLLRESVRNVTWIAIGMAGVGMYVMVREGLAAGALSGNAAAILSAFGFAVFTLTLRWGRTEDMMPAVVLGGVFSMVVAVAVLAAQGQGLTISPWDAGVSMAIGAGILAGGMVLYTLGSRVLPAAELTLLALIEVLLAPLWVWALRGETASAATFVGGGILLAAVVFNALAGRGGISVRAK